VVWGTQPLKITRGRVGSPVGDTTSIIERHSRDPGDLTYERRVLDDARTLVFIHTPTAMPYPFMFHVLHGWMRDRPIMSSESV